MANLVHNEQVKLGATFMNNISVAAFVAGILIPGIAIASENSVVSFIGAESLFSYGVVPAHSWYCTCRVTSPP
jgi:hypothetical protein